MRKLILVGLASILLAACSQSGSEGASKSPAGADTTATAGTAATSGADFPPGVAPTFPYKIRSRNVSQSPNGEVHRLMIEFKKGDVKSIDKTLEQQITSQGYKRYKTYSESGDELVGDYGMDGHRVTVTTAPADGKLALDPDSVGTVYFVWH